ncbi:MAG: hypothetical protein ACT4QF_21845 [Sporichthyaceae bacterium]|jgi:hypothetical protein
MGSPDPTTHPDDDATAVLARNANMDLVQFVRVLGGGWRRIPGEDAGLQTGPYTERSPEIAMLLGLDPQVYVSGEPLQVAIAIAGHEWVLGAAHLAWHGQRPLVEFLDPLVRWPGGYGVVPAHVADAARAARQRRRRSFRWCDYCARLQAPGHMAAGACHDCAGRYLGAAF